jgi:hypothetical protein
VNFALPLEGPPPAFTAISTLPHHLPFVRVTTERQALGLKACRASLILQKTARELLDEEHRQRLGCE